MTSESRNLERKISFTTYLNQTESRRHGDEDDDDYDEDNDDDVGNGDNESPWNVHLHVEGKQPVADLLLRPHLNRIVCPDDEEFCGWDGDCFHLSHGEDDDDDENDDDKEGVLPVMCSGCCRPLRGERPMSSR